MMTPFTRLIRFKDTAGRILYGEGPANNPCTGQRVIVYSGKVPWELQRTDETAEVAEVCRRPSEKGNVCDEDIL